MQALVADTTVAAALFYHKFVTAYILCLLPGVETDGVRIFGKVQSYYGTTRAQGCGTMHIHMMVQMADMPTGQILDCLKTKCYWNECVRNVQECISASLPDCTKPIPATLMTGKAFAITRRCAILIGFKPPLHGKD
jgi:hypothetical protein